ncbi:MAG: DUF177 domain-containing protein [Chloroflexi bacterium]|nr:DUF177 domain-containing protein [Chloroflexota bacterium]
MRFNVAQLLKEAVGSFRQDTLDEIFPRLEDAGVAWVRGEVKFTKTDRGIWVQGTLQTRAASVCGRCLAEYQQPLTIRFDEEYLPTLDIVTGISLPVTDQEQGAFRIDEHHMLDLLEAVRQYAITSQPMKPLCQDDCRGLCPVCGGNRNEVACDCGTPRVEPRWNELLKLLAHQNR